MCRASHSSKVCSSGLRRDVLVDVARLVAAHHQRPRRQSKPLLGPPNLLRQGRQIPRPDGSLTEPAPCRAADPRFPLGKLPITSDHPPGTPTPREPVFTIPGIAVHDPGMGVHDARNGRSGWIGISVQDGPAHAHPSTRCLGARSSARRARLLLWLVLERAVQGGRAGHPNWEMFCRPQWIGSPDPNEPILWSYCSRPWQRHVSSSAAGARCDEPRG